MAEHEPIPSCADQTIDACVACSEAEDRCVSWPCKHATVTVGLNDLDLALTMSWLLPKTAKAVERLRAAVSERRQG